MAEASRFVGHETERSVCADPRQVEKSSAIAAHKGFIAPLDSVEKIHKKDENIIKQVVDFIEAVDEEIPDIERHSDETGSAGDDRSARNTFEDPIHGTRQDVSDADQAN